MIALVWKRQVDLHLHVFENGVRSGEAGHVWRASSQRASEALGRLESWTIDTPNGDRIEVYTAPVTRPVTLTFAVDYATRGDIPTGPHCEGGTLARIPFDLITRRPDGAIDRISAAFAPAPCNVAIAPEARINRSVFPVFRVGAQ
jgi:hypothetical protein